MLPQSCAIVAALVLAPFEIAASGPAPTLDAPESEALAERVSGTLVIADGSGAITLLDLPTRTVRRIEVGDRVLAATAPDEAGRIAYLREYYPWHQALSGVLFGAAKPRTLLASRALDGETERVLADVRSDRPLRTIQLSRRGGRVLHFDPPRRLEVFDLESRTRLELPPLHEPIGLPRIDADGQSIVYPRVVHESDVPPVALGAGRRVVTWVLDLAGRSDQARHAGWCTPADVDDEIVALQLGADEHPETSSPPGRVGGLVLVVAPGLAIYDGLAGPSAGARSQFALTYPSFERSIRLGELDGNATTTLVPHFAVGTFAFTPRRFLR